MSALIVIAVVFVGFGVIAMIAAAVERLPSFPPMYDDSDIIHEEPNPRTVVRRRHQVPL